MSAASPLPYPNGGGGPAAYNDPRANGNGAGNERPYQHISDLQNLAFQNYNPYSSIPTLLQIAETSLRQAYTLVDYKRPDLAFVEFLRASEIVLNVVPHHKDYTHFTIDQPKNATRLRLLRNSVASGTDQFEKVKESIESNNRRLGTRPREDRQNGHGRTESEQTNGESRPGSSGLQAQAGPKVKPSPSPKPEKLHGHAISKPATGSSTSAGDALNDRFARLRMQQQDAIQRPDSRASDSSRHSMPLTMPSAGDYNGRSSFDPLTRTASIPSKPQGPRALPNGQAPPPLQIPNLPQEPPATYSPARNMQTTGNIAAPRQTARSLAGTSRRTSTAYSSASVVAPNGYAQSGDYFPAQPTNGTAPGPPPRRTSVNVPPELSIDAARLYDYLERYQVLLIDFRPRAEFDQGHIYARNIICIEPLSVRQGMSAAQLSDALVISPDNEQILFDNRDQYDVVVYYDADSATEYPFNQRKVELRYLHETLYNFNEEKPLQRPPILLKGGIAAWQDLVGSQALMSSKTVEKVKAGRPLARRPLATATMSSESQLRVPKRRLRDYKPLDAEEEQSWQERARAESVVLPQTPGLVEGEELGNEDETIPEGDEAPESAIREFLDRFPEAGDLDKRAFASQRPDRAPPAIPAKIPEYPPPPPPSAYPSVPARPAPAAPRTSYMGVSDRTASSASRTSSSQLREYRPPTLRLPKTGLANFGNTCYMNSTLQALSATIPLSSFFLEDAFRAQLQKDSWKGSKGVLSELYSNLMRNLWKNDVECVRPTTFRTYCKRIASQFNNDDQQDAKEFLDFVLDTLHEDLNAMWARSPLRTLTEKEEALRERMPKLIVAKTEWERYVHRDLSFVTGLFAGQHASKLTCLTCGFTSTTYEAFTSLSVEIPTRSSAWENGRQPTLQDCLRSFCAEERLTDGEQWHCPRCKTFREAKKRITLTRAPQFLVIHFKRFATSSGVMGMFRSASRTQKVRLPVNFPLHNLHLDPFMLQPPTPSETAVISQQYGPKHLATEESMTPPYTYDAYAVVRHHGSTMQSGHYTTVARDRARGCWKKFDDSRVTDFRPPEEGGSGERLQSEDAYIVFYQRVGVQQGKM